MIGVNESSTDSSLFEFKKPEEVIITVGPGGRRVGVFCGSSPSINPVYLKAARRFGELLREHHCALIYGGGDWGMMGEVAKGAHPACTVGVLPELMLKSSGQNYGQVVIVPDMATRKAIEDGFSDVFVALPGGVGTLDEITEMLTWNLLGVRSKKVVALLNTNGYWDFLIKWIKHASNEGLLNESDALGLLVKDTPEELIQEILNLQVPSPNTEPSQ